MFSFLEGKSNNNNKVDPLANPTSSTPTPSAAATTALAPSPRSKLKNSPKSAGSTTGAATASNSDDNGSSLARSSSSNIDIRKKKIKDGKLSIAFVWVTSIAMAMSLFQIMTYEPDIHNHQYHASLSSSSSSNAGDATTILEPPHPLAHMIDHSEWKLKHKDKPKQRKSYNFERHKNKQQQQQQQQQKQERHASSASIINTTTTTAATSTIKANEKGMVVLADVIAQDPTWADNPLIQVLMQQAKMTEIAWDDFQQLPNVTLHLQHLYHRTTSSTLTDPNILGLDTCAYYRNVVAPNVKDRYASAAGMFNTGTNALTFALEHNVKSPLFPPWQVPWGKHRMEYRRLNHVAPGLSRFNQTQCLPVVIIRDPFAWMQSMCKNPYAAHWHHHPKLRCPNLVPTPHDRHKWPNLSWDGGTEQENEALESFPVKVIFDEHDVGYYQSLVGLWSDWYRPYLNATYPRIMIRFEDFLLQAPLIIQRISECMGLPPVAVEDFKIETSSAKAHGSHTTFLKAIIKSGNVATRTLGLTRQDLDYAAQHLDMHLMNTFHYHLPDDD